MKRKLYFVHIMFYLIFKTYHCGIQPWLVLPASVRITKIKAATKPLELHLPATKVEAFYDFTPILPFLLFQKIKNKNEAQYCPPYHFRNETR